MTDVVSAQKRSEMMSGIRGKDTAPELLVRRALFGMGYRYRLHRKDLPGRPDIVLPGRRIAVFVHGCFWHAHHDCRFAKTPSTRTEFWTEKLRQNRARDARDLALLQNAGWRTLVVWECALRKRSRSEPIDSELKAWIEGIEPAGEIRGNQLLPTRKSLADIAGVSQGQKEA
jgi:DNA mismatch endonuclease, patch repair protein